MEKAGRGLFVTGNDTEVGKTYVTALIARQLVAAGRRVGVYKPAASGCRHDGDRWVCEDAEVLWDAAGRPGELEAVCPQQFAAPLAPHLAAREEGRELDANLLRTGLKYWLDRSEIVLVEGVGGLMSPVSDDEYVADLAYEFGRPVVIVAANSLGVINQTLQTLITASTFRDGLQIAGVVLNHPLPPSQSDVSRRSNRQQVEQRCVSPLLGQIDYGADHLDREVDWWSLAAQGL